MIQTKSKPDIKIRIRKEKGKSLSPIHLQIKNAPVGEFEVQETTKAGVMRISRRYPTNLDKYFGAFRRNQKQGINPDQHGAGLRFMRDYHVATKALSCKLSSMGASGGGGLMEDAILDASHEIKKGMLYIERHSGRVNMLVVEKIAGWNEGTADCEKSYNWPRGHAIVRLREGLDSLIFFYTSVRAGWEND
jgi:hypothetical protein